MMSNNFYDDDWDPKGSSNKWDDNYNSEDNSETKSIKLRLKINPRIATISSLVLVLMFILISVIPGLFNKSNSAKLVKPLPSPSQTSAPMVVDLYSQPKLLQTFIDNALASAVTIYCGNYSGSGWAIDLSDDASTSVDDAYPTEVITNNHVIEGCEKSGVTIVPMGTSEQSSAFVYSTDIDNDLAILMTSKYLEPFNTIKPGSEARVGQWVMAVGSPGAGDTTLDGSITTGTITNLKEGVVITDTTINPGNSGGPLLNAAGQVIAVVSAKIVDAKIDSIGIARNVSLICEQLAGCTKKSLLK
jgi:S1-C subfamily serine protease